MERMNYQFKARFKKAIVFLIVAFSLVLLPLTLYLVSKRQDIGKGASGTGTPIPVIIKVNNPGPKPGERIEITVTTTDSRAKNASLFYIAYGDINTYGKVCAWPGGRKVINYKVPLNQPFSWQVPNEDGKFYLVANLVDSVGKPICAGAFSWKGAACNNGLPKCQNGYSELNVTKKFLELSVSKN
ncbi:MAG: hypothetical protein ABID04_03095, partial [Patescibacteria group bacterium]